MTREEAIFALNPRRELWNDSRFQAWVSDVEREVQELQELAFVVTKASATRDALQATKLEKLGLEPPQTAADALGLFIALRCVLNFWRRNLEQLKLQSAKADELEKQLANARARDSLGR
jgi:hypothetical protein